QAGQVLRVLGHAHRSNDLVVLERIHNSCWRGDQRDPAVLQGFQRFGCNRNPAATESRCGVELQVRELPVEIRCARGRKELSGGALVLRQLRRRSHFLSDKDRPVIFLSDKKVLSDEKVDGPDTSLLEAPRVPYVGEKTIRRKPCGEEETDVANTEKNTTLGVLSPS